MADEMGLDIVLLAWVRIRLKWICNCSYIFLQRKKWNVHKDNSINTQWIHCLSAFHIQLMFCSFCKFFFFIFLLQAKIIKLFLYFFLIFTFQLNNHFLSSLSTFISFCLLLFFLLFLLFSAFFFLHCSSWCLLNCIFNFIHFFFIFCFQLVDKRSATWKKHFFFFLLFVVGNRIFMFSCDALRDSNRLLLTRALATEISVKTIKC